MKNKIKVNSGVSLIALIITILVMLILAGIAISSTVGDKGVITQSENAGEEQRWATINDYRDLWKSSLKTDKYSTTKSAQKLSDLLIMLKENELIKEDEKEFILENGYITIAEKDIEFFKLPNLGDYIEYDVEYTDMYTGYNFTATTGWRYLGRSGGNSLIISTGIPLKLYYDSSNNTGRQKNGWWGTDEEVKEMFGEEYSENGYTAYPNRYAIVGMLKHFEDIPYTQTTNNPTQNKMTGTVVGNGPELVSGQGNTLGTALRSAKLANSIIDVHNLTLAEANRALKKNEDNIYISSSDVFFLKKLTQYGYGESTVRSYWLATTANKYGDDKEYIYRVWNEGYVNEVTGGFSYMAARPVITLSSEIMFEYNEEGYYEIH